VFIRGTLLSLNRYHTGRPGRSGGTKKSAAVIVFSSTEVARELSRVSLLHDAENYAYLHRLPEQDEPEQSVEAAAG
jgi:hypothetical protein